MPTPAQDVPDGERGLLLAKGPGVMAGYYNDPGATAKVRPNLPWKAVLWLARAFDGLLAPEGCSAAAHRCVLVLPRPCKPRPHRLPPFHVAPMQAFQAGDGWFDTGDLGWRAPEGVAGSAMAGTIVLTGADPPLWFPGHAPAACQSAYSTAPPAGQPRLSTPWRCWG